MIGLILQFYLIGIYLSGRYHIDSTKVELNFPYKEIEISYTNGKIDVEYFPSATFSFPYLIIKKVARGKKEKFKEWIEKVEIIKEEKNGFCKIKVKFPEKFKGLWDLGVNLKLFLPYKLDSLKIGLMNGKISIKNDVSKKWEIRVANGDINFEEIKGEGSMGVCNGDINGLISHQDTLHMKIGCANGDISLSVPSFTQIFPSVLNGKIKGDLSCEKSEIFQRIKCSVMNGDIKIKRR